MESVHRSVFSFVFGSDYVIPKNTTMNDPIVFQISIVEDSWLIQGCQIFIGKNFYLLHKLMFIAISNDKFFLINNFLQFCRFTKHAVGFMGFMGFFLIRLAKSAEGVNIAALSIRHKYQLKPIKLTLPVCSLKLDLEFYLVQCYSFDHIMSKHYDQTIRLILYTSFLKPLTLASYFLIYV